jgi:RNA-binding protein
MALQFALPTWSLNCIPTQYNYGADQREGSRVELRGKQKRFLRALGVTLNPILTIGKDGVSEHTIMQAQGVLLARELIKVRVLGTAPVSAGETAAAVAGATDAALVQVVGRNFLLYKPHPEEPQIQLP